MSKYLNEEGLTHFTQKIKDGTIVAGKANQVPASGITGVIPIEHIPQDAQERLVKVANQAARFKLTVNDVQLGDTVQEVDTGLMWFVIDTSKLNSANGYQEYTAGKASSAASADSVEWNGVKNKPSTLKGYGITDASIVGGQVNIGGNYFKTNFDIPLKIGKSIQHIKYDSTDRSQPQQVTYSLDAIGAEPAFPENVTDSIDEGISIETEDGRLTAVVFTFNDADLSINPSLSHDGITPILTQFRFRQDKIESRYKFIDNESESQSKSFSEWYTFSSIDVLDKINAATSDEALSNNEIDAAIAAAK